MTELNAAGPDCAEVVSHRPSADWLAAFTRILVEGRLVAYGHSIASIRAIYRWAGEIHDEPQARVVLHTRASLGGEIVVRAGRDNTDAVPCVIALPIRVGNPQYLQ